MNVANEIEAIGLIPRRKVKELIQGKIQDSIDQLKENASNLDYPETAEGVKQMGEDIYSDSEGYANLLVDDYLISSYLDTAKLLSIKLDPELEKEAREFADIF